MRAYSNGTDVQAAEILAIVSINNNLDKRLMLAAPEISATTATFLDVTRAWAESQLPVVGGFAVEKGGVYGFIPKDTFNAIFTLVV